MTDMQTTYITAENKSYDDVPVAVTYEVIGFGRLHITDIKADMPGEAGPSLIDEFDIEDVAADICARLEWKSEPRHRGDN